MYTFALDVSTHSVVANSKRLIVGVALVVHHAAAELLGVCPDHLGVMTSSGIEPGNMGDGHDISDIRNIYTKGLTLSLSNLETSSYL